MAYSVNKVILIGNLTRNPQMNYTPSGKAVCKVGLATNESYKDKEGVKHDKVEFHNLVFWGKLAEIVAEFCVKGAKIYVEGKQTTNVWKDKETGKNRYSTENIIKEMVMLESKGEKVSPVKQDRLTEEDINNSGITNSEDLADDVPF